MRTCIRSCPRGSPFLTCPREVPTCIVLGTNGLFSQGSLFGTFPRESSSRWENQHGPVFSCPREVFCYYQSSLGNQFHLKTSADLCICSCPLLTPPWGKKNDAHFSQEQMVSCPRETFLELLAGKVRDNGKICMDLCAVVPVKSSAICCPWETSLSAFEN